MKKRILSTFMAFVLLIAMLPVQAGAASLYGLSYEIYEDHVEVTDCSSLETKVVIPAEVEGLPVTVIGDNAFFGCNKLISITIPDSVTSIGDDAFSNCTKLPSIDLPDSITSIGEDAFYYCGSLTSIDFSENLASIGIRAFSRCTSLTSIDLPGSLSSFGSDAFEDCTSLETVNLLDGITSIGDSAFQGCTSLTSVSIPDSVTSIGESAFQRCSSLPSVSIPDSVTSIEESAFRSCSSLNGIYVDENNPNYSNDDRGVLFDKAQTKLIQAPAAISGPYTIPDGVVTLNSYAFHNCDDLTSVSIPYGVTSLNSRTFLSCDNLTSVDLPDSLTYIGWYAFEDCTSLISIDLPDGVTSIGNSAFNGCTSLTSISLSDSLTTINTWAFSDCTSLTSIDLPDGVTTIWGSAFRNCSGLTSMDIPSSVTTIGDSAFIDCTNLSTIIFRGDAPQLGQSVFSNVTANAYYPLGNTTWTDTATQAYGGKINWVAHDPSHDPDFKAVVTAPTCTEQGFTTYTCECGNSFTSDYVNALKHDYADGVCTRCGKSDVGFEYKVYEDHVEIIPYNGSASEAVIPAEIEGKPVTVIVNSAFSYCTSLTSITLPDSLTSIGSSAFSYCSSLTSIDLPDSLTSISWYAFENCTSLTSISFHGDAPSFSSYVFSNVSALAYYPADNTTWTAAVMQDYGGEIIWVEHGHTHDYRAVITAPTCTKQGFTTYTCACSYSFASDYTDALGHDFVGETCSRCGLDPNLQYEVNFDRVKITGYTGSAAALVIPAEIENHPVTSIASGAFNGCTSLTSVSIPNGITTIADSTFKNCSNLTSVVLPDSITSIESSAFYHCTSLTSIDIPSNVTSIGTHAFEGCDSLTSVVLPSGITSISSWAFSHCHNLISVTIPKSVTFIDSYAFAYSPSLARIDIPAGVTSLGLDPFDGCYSLTGIHVDANNPNYSSDERGVLFNKAKTKLIKAPGALSGSYTIPDGVTAISKNAFHYCEQLESASIPEGVKIIESYTFGECSSLTSVSIPNTVTTICYSAFYRCIGLTSISLPDSVTTIEKTAFWDCTNLAFIDLPDNLTTLQYATFYHCTGLLGITIPASVRSIETTAFMGCTDLSSIIFEGDAPTFDQDLFADVTATAHYPADNATWTEDVMQDYGGSITWVTHDPSHTSEYTSVVTAPTCTEQGFTTYTCTCGYSYVSDYVDALGHDFASGVCTRCSWNDNGLQYRVCDDHVIITRYTGNSAEVVIPAEIRGLPVTTIGNFAFKRCLNMAAISIPDSMTSIGREAFDCCYGLTDITIPASVTSIRWYAFGYCTGLDTITFQGNAHDLAVRIFTDVTATAYYPANNATWTEEAMEKYGGTITWVPYDTSHIHEYTTVVTAPTCTEQGFTTYTCKCGDSYVGDYVDALGHDFADGICCIRCNLLHESLQYQVYEDHVEITKYTGNAEEIVIPAEIEGLPVTAIGNAAFFNRLQLTSVSLPESITSIGSRAFQGCSYLTSIAIPDGVTTIGEETFADCIRLTSVSLPDSITSIGENAFCGCCALADISFPDGVTSIGDYAFGCCENLSSIAIPGSVASVGTGAFSGCYGLESITFLGDAPVFGKYVFEFVTTTAYYPSGNATWTEDVMQDYDGDITWVAQQSAHTHEYSAVTTAPTCTARGFTTYTCACSYSYAADYTDALGHDYADGICTRCGEADPSHQQPSENPFTDVPAGAYYEVPVLWALENGITAGATATSFAPDDPCLRAQVVSFLHRAEGSPEPLARAISFTDVKTNDFFYKPVLWAVEKGITYGVSSTKFGSYEVCNRAAVVTFLWRAAGSPEPTSTKNPFTDVRASDYFYKAILWAVENGIAYGMDATHFGPTAACNRAQVVTFLYRAYS